MATVKSTAAKKNPSAVAFSAATKNVMAWVKTEHADRWAQTLGDAREAQGLPRETSVGRRSVHGTFKAWVRHIEKGETPCRLCAEAFEAKTSPLVRPPAEGVPADPVEIPRTPKPSAVPAKAAIKVLACHDCDFTIAADRHIALAAHIRQQHDRRITSDERKPVAPEEAA